MYFLDIVKHKPSGRNKLVYYCVHNYNLKQITKEKESHFTNYWSWKFFDSMGTFGGEFVELVARRFTLKWFIKIFTITL